MSVKRIIYVHLSERFVCKSITCPPLVQGIWILTWIASVSVYTIYQLSQNSIFPWAAMTYGLCKLSSAMKVILWTKGLSFHNFELLHLNIKRGLTFSSGIDSTFYCIGDTGHYLFTAFYYKSCDCNCARVIYSDLSDTEITVMIAMQCASLWASHPLAKLEAILRCLMTKRLGDNIDYTVLSIEHMQQLGPKVSHEQRQGKQRLP